MATERTANPSVESSAKVLDTEILQELRDSLSGQPAALASVYSKFLSNAASFIRALREQDGEARIRTLHTLKGSAAMMGANRMAVLAARLQAQFPSTPAGAAAALELLEAELAMLRQALIPHFDSSGGLTEP